MIDIELDALDDEGHWRLVLQAYRAEQAEHAKAQPEESDSESDGWLPRIASVEGVAAEHLPRIHGRLIATGYLKFQLAGRTAGIRYQLSPVGLRALQAGNRPPSEVPAPQRESA